MARIDSYSRTVRWLKVALPLGALAILSTLFMVAETLDPEAAIPYAEVDVDRILQEQGVTRPAFGGITADGVKVSLGAESVRPVDGLFRGLSLDVEMVFPKGGALNVISPEGTIDMAEEAAVLKGGVTLDSTSGYRVNTDQITTAWSTAVIETAGPVTASGPAGTVDAGRMVLSQGGENGGHLLVFKDGVRLVYQPQP